MDLSFAPYVFPFLAPLRETPSYSANLFQQNLETVRLRTRSIQFSWGFSLVGPFGDGEGLGLASVFSPSISMTLSLPRARV